MFSGTRTKVIEDASGGRRGRVRLGLFILEAGLHHSSARIPGNAGYSSFQHREMHLAPT